MSDPSATHYSISQLHAQGWTDRLIATTFGKPDLYTPNPHFAPGNLKRWYLKSKVDPLLPSFALQLNHNLDRRQQLSLAREQKLLSTQKEIISRSEQLVVPLLSPQHLLAEVRRAWKVWGQESTGQSYYLKDWAYPDPQRDALCLEYLAYLTLLPHDSWLFEYTNGKPNGPKLRQTFYALLWQKVRVAYPALQPIKRPSLFAPLMP